MQLLRRQCRREMSGQFGLHAVAICLGWRSQDRRGMPRDERLPTPGRRKDLAARAEPFGIATQHGMGRGLTETHEHGRSDGGKLGIEPRSARAHLNHARLLMQSLLADRLPRKMFHGVRDVNSLAREPCFGECRVEYPAGRPDERLAGEGIRAWVARRRARLA